MTLSTSPTQYTALKRKALEKYFSKMNPCQQEAVFHTEGPLLILAGAGSGKTTVVVNRIENLIEFGSAYYSDEIPWGVTDEDIAFLEEYVQGVSDDSEQLKAVTAYRPVQPWNILAITFTNKAAGELKERLSLKLGKKAHDIWAATFHSACVRILRGKAREAVQSNLELLGYDKNFTIYDTDDSLRVVKEGIKQMGESDKSFPPRMVLTEISRAKDNFLSPKEYLACAKGDFRKEIIGKIYEHYQKRLKQANAMDFDDIIVQTVRLFEENPDVLAYYQNRFRYIMVDEYQDTNTCQYRLVSLLGGGHQNLCVVGDDDQSIYKFRGATIENILSFEKQFPGTKVVKLEQNYRCTQNILDAANQVIRHNTQRKGKTLWTGNGSGEKIHVFRGYNEMDEGEFIANTILDHVRQGEKFSDHAILYRMNSQSNTIENCLVRAGIPYKIIGGLRFYERKEIKDVMAYLSIISNSADSVRLKRIINEPKRGIGAATLVKAEEISDQLGITLFQVLREADNYQPLAGKSGPLKDFAEMIDNLSLLAEELSLEELVDKTLEDTGYLKMLKGLGEEGATRIENVNELKSNILKYEETAEEPSLAGFLEEATLYTELDSLDENSDYTVMMTMHSAKGLEFPNVFFCGAEEGIFPGMQAIYNPEQIEEERRLAYVCITRAKKRLYISTAMQRMLFGRTSRNNISRFVEEIPQELCSIQDKTIRKTQASPVRSAPTAPKTNSGASLGVGKQPAPKAGVVISVGDRVRHRVFGDGLVTKVTPMGGDHLLEITFDSGEHKKVMQTFARLQKL